VGVVEWLRDAYAVYCTGPSGACVAPHARLPSPILNTCCGQDLNYLGHGHRQGWVGGLEPGDFLLESLDNGLRRGARLVTAVKCGDVFRQRSKPLARRIVEILMPLNLRSKTLKCAVKSLLIHGPPPLVYRISYIWIRAHSKLRERRDTPSADCWHAEWPQRWMESRFCAAPDLVGHRQYNAWAMPLNRIGLVIRHAEVTCRRVDGPPHTSPVRCRQA